MAEISPRDVNYSRSTSLSQIQAYDKKPEILPEHKKLKEGLQTHMKESGLIKDGSQYRQLSNILNEAFQGLSKQCGHQSHAKFLTQVLKTFFLELSVDQIELMCQSYADNFLKELLGKSVNLMDLDAAEEDILQSNVNRNKIKKDKFPSVSMISDFVELKDEKPKNTYQHVPRLNLDTSLAKSYILDITSKYMNDPAPRYMSPTQNQIQKLEAKINQYEEPGPLDLTQQLRKQPKTTRGRPITAWKPQNSRINVDCFDKIKPAPKLEKFIQYGKKSISPVRTPVNQDELFARLHNERCVRDFTKNEKEILKQDEEMKKCTFVPNQQRQTGGIKVFKNGRVVRKSFIAHTSRYQTRVGGLSPSPTNNSILITKSQATNPEGLDKIRRKQVQMNEDVNVVLYDGRNKSASLIEDANLFNMKNKSMHLLLYDEENHQTVQYGQPLNFNQDRDQQQVQVNASRAKEQMSPEFITNFLEAQDQKSNSTPRNGKQRKKKELFNYLATQGQKADRQYTLAMEKQKQELENCTFQPKIISNYQTEAPETIVEKLTKPRVGRKQRVTVHEKLNQKAKDKEEKIHSTYEEARKWRELKDCTFTPNINNKFYKRRTSNSAQAFYQTGTIDPYYQKLNSNYLPVDDEMRKLTYDASGTNKSVRSGSQPSQRDSSPSRFDLLYKTHAVYKLKKEQYKEQLFEEEKQECTYRPKLYKSKVKPTEELNHKVYQKGQQDYKPRIENYERLTQGGYEIGRWVQTINQSVTTSSIPIVSVKQDIAASQSTLPEELRASPPREASKEKQLDQVPTTIEENEEGTIEHKYTVLDKYVKIQNNENSSQSVQQYEDSFQDANLRSKYDKRPSVESEERQDKRVASRNVATPDFTEQPDDNIAHTLALAPVNVFAAIPEDQDQDQPLTNDDEMKKQTTQAPENPEYQSHRSLEVAKGVRKSKQDRMKMRQNQISQQKHQLEEAQKKNEPANDSKQYFDLDQFD